MQVLADDVLEAAKQIIEDQSEDYTMEEVDEELEMLAKRGQQVRDHLEGGMASLAIQSSSRRSGRCSERSRHR